MQRIILDPDRLRSLGSQLQQAAEQLRTLDGQLSSNFNNLDLELRQRANMDGQMAQVHSQAGNLAGQVEAMARGLTGKAQAFEEADRQSAAAIPTADTLTLPALPALPVSPPALPVDQAGT